MASRLASRSSIYKHILYHLLTIYQYSSFSEESRMDFPTLKALLSSSESKNILKALIDIRTRVVKSQSGLEGLLEENFVRNLVSLFHRSNPKIIELSLSILANLLQEDMASGQAAA